MSAMGIYKQDSCWYIYLYTFISLAAKQIGLFLDKMLSMSNTTVTSLTTQFITKITSSLPYEESKFQEPTVDS